jgi:hypothetical protein
MPQVFQTFWWKGALSPYEVACLRSFVAHGHAVTLFTYDRDLAVPPGVTLANARDILPEDRVFHYASGFGAGSVSAFSNLFRYRLLLERGGWWIETDVLCLTPDIPDLPMFFAWQDARLINCAVMTFPPGHAVMDECGKTAESVGDKAVWGQIGPRLLTETLLRHGLQHFAFPPSFCYPIAYQNTARLFEVVPGAVQVDRRLTWMLHLWNQKIVQLGVDKSQPPGPTTLLGRLIAAIP